MQVKELIEMLNNMDPDAMVYVVNLGRHMAVSSHIAGPVRLCDVDYEADRDGTVYIVTDGDYENIS